ncbi:hypothetical protein FF38_10274 [Lucilia cuprina]|uniref:Uncharacterized protein n=1 Tax=Lucilia cuprina TaxID=7375 RepID=A0A0L0CQL6_LUCCU|nr:uncharacterized protein LOC111677454 [Lucilia cuprina]KAI8128314.1 hypothetical protein CVS40_2380 [Lucilia cuprina]KNC34665.1 hypothetical protein FF38_10274 [Lucilia cuprina]
MEFACIISKLFVYLSFLVAVCQTYPVVNSDGTYNAELSDPELSHQTELSDDDLALHSQAELSSDSGGLRISLFKAAEKTRESVNLETEGVPSKVLSLYDKTQKKYFDKTQPLPILDTISEHEKYGNNGDMFDGISRSLVNGYEAFSNLLNTLIQKPKEIARSISKGITAQLDVIGGKIVGL